MTDLAFCQHCSGVVRDVASFLVVKGKSIDEVLDHMKKRYGTIRPYPTKRQL